MQYPSDENAPWAASGIQAYWESEMTQHTQTKPALGQITVRAHKLAAIVPMTDELLQDVPSMSSYLTTKASEKFDFKINDAIINGSGVGMPMGVLNAACTVSVAKETSQTAATVNFQNVIKMWNRLYAKCRGNAIWLVNQDVEQQLQAMTFPTASGTAVAPYLPPGGISGAPYATIFGRPVIAIESMAALGTVGDIMLCDFSQYLALVKGGMRQDISMHLWFDYDITAFRFVLRIGGQPWWSTAVTRKNSSNSASPFVSLATRA
jgi:HK97 family phage major capsid protein